MKQISRKKQTLALLAVAQIMVILDFSIVSIALPAIQQAFYLAPADLQWVVSVYAVMFGGFLLLFGRACDLFDRKKLFIVGLGIFSLASLVGGLAPSPLIVLIARAVQGLGAAIVSSAALALVLATFEEGPERNRALGVFGSVAGIGFSIGVILGGVLTGFLNWRWVFFVNLPIGLLTMLLAIPVLASSRAFGPRQRLDLAGAVLGTSTIVLLVLALSRLATPGADLLQALLLALFSMILGLSFALVERRHPHALVPLPIFRIRNLASANLIAGLASAVASILAFVLTLYLQHVLGFTPLLAGLIFLPAGLGGIAGGPVASWAIRRLGLRGAAILGAGLIVLSSALMATISATSGVVQVTIGYTLAGIGVVCIMITTSIAGTAQLKREMQGLAAGLLNTSQQIGGAIGTSVASLVATAVTLASGGSGKLATTTGYQAVLYLTLGLALTAGVLALLTLRAHVVPAMSASISEAVRAETR